MNDCKGEQSVNCILCRKQKDGDDFHPLYCDICYEELRDEESNLAVDRLKNED